MKSVFNAYGINVDYRHLSLIADYMTYEGIYKPFNRIGIKANASPLQKMSFETCLQFFKDAVLTGKLLARRFTACNLRRVFNLINSLGQYENFDSPSSRIVAGRTVKAGTGCFELLTKLI
jgi:DNA-directed RNA polymerase I subunit RPA1